MSVSPRSATPLSCGVLADVNSRLMPRSLHISENRPYINSGASSERIIAGGPTSLVSAKYCFRASGASDLCFMKYSRDILVASSRTIKAYCFPPMECTGFLPEVSTKTLPCLLSDRDWVVFFTGALNPFAAEHPTHGSSLTPGLSLTPCCFADSLSRRGWVWAVVRW